MITIRQHIPNWADMEANAASVESVADVFELPFVKSWKNDAGFFRFSQSRDDHWSHPDRWMLMCELNEGTNWWVVAYSDHSLDLPAWKPVKKVGSLFIPDSH